MNREELLGIMASIIFTSRTGEVPLGHSVPRVTAIARLMLEEVENQSGEHTPTCLCEYCLLKKEMENGQP